MVRKERAFGLRQAMSQETRTGTAIRWCVGSAPVSGRVRDLTDLALNSSTVTVGFTWPPQAGWAPQDMPQVPGAVWALQLKILILKAGSRRISRRTWLSVDTLAKLRFLWVQRKWRNMETCG
jgi:hypothetical protein